MRKLTPFDRSAQTIPQLFTARVIRTVDALSLIHI